MTEERCPLCRLPIRAIGRLIAAIDDAGQHFVFATCRRCLVRLERLPPQLQRRQMTYAINELARHPDRYTVTFFDSYEAAALYCHLEAERLISTTH